MLELRYEIEDIKETNEELRKCRTETVNKLNELKEKMKEKKLVKELDFKSSAIRDCSAGCDCHV